MGLNESEMERLAFVKHLFEEGEESVNKPMPLANKSLLEFHDAVELFMLLLLEREGASIPDKLKEYPGVIEQVYGKEMDYKPTVKTLDDSRGNLKHLDVKVSQSTIQSLSTELRAFFEKNMSKFLDLDFDDISLIHLVEYEEVKELLNQVQDLKDDGEHDEAMQKVRLAFQELIEQYQPDNQGRYSSFRFGGEVDSMRFDDGTATIGGAKVPNARILRKTIDAVDSIQDAMQVMALDLDYRKYAKFDTLTPVMHQIPGGEPNFQWVDRPDTLTDEDVEYCKEFVIESALKLQDFQFEL